MTKNKAAYIALFIILTGSIILYKLKESSAASKELFVTLPIEGYSKASIPYCNVRIKDQVIQTKIDLGYEGSLSVPHIIYCEVQNNYSPLLQGRYGLDGKKYLVKTCQIGKISIGEMDFSPKEIQESNPDLEKQMVLRDVDPNKIENMGRIGWHLFQDYILLVDCKNQQLCLSDNLYTLKKHGYSIDAFAKTSFNVNRKFIEFEAISDTGTLHCILDTGATWNLYNQSFNGPYPEKPLFDIEDTFDTSLFQVGDKNFGPITFNRIYSPTNIEAIIGMEFFEDNMVIIDFKNHTLYFAPYETS